MSMHEPGLCIPMRRYANIMWLLAPALSCSEGAQNYSCAFAHSEKDTAFFLANQHSDVRCVMAKSLCLPGERYSFPLYLSTFRRAR